MNLDHQDGAGLRMLAAGCSDEEVQDVLRLSHLEVIALRAAAACAPAPPRIDASLGYEPRPPALAPAPPMRAPISAEAAAA